MRATIFRGFWLILFSIGGPTLGTWCPSLVPTLHAEEQGFSLKDTAGDHLDILLNGKVAARYMYAFDKSTSKRHEETFKPYLHVFDAEGNQPITKGPGGFYTHHRGIFIGWQSIEFEGKKYNLWEMASGDIVHQKFLAQKATADEASFTSLTHWNDKEGQTILIEERTMTFHRGPDSGRLTIDFHTKLSAPNGDVTLTSNPEHGGVQYRPANEIDKSQTVYVFPKANAKPHNDDDYPWVGETYVLDGKKYSVIDLNSPGNPKKTKFSAYRNYGRFGAYSVATIKKGESREWDYQFLVFDGEMPAAASIEKWWDAYTHATSPSPVPEETVLPAEGGGPQPPKTTTKKKVDPAKKSSKEAAKPDADQSKP